MTRVKKNDLVRLVNRPSYYYGLILDWENGIVIKGPYEESITVTEVRGNNDVNLITLVCDVMADGVLYSSIPLELLARQ